VGGRFVVGGRTVWRPRSLTLNGLDELGELGEAQLLRGHFADRKTEDDDIELLVQGVLSQGWWCGQVRKMLLRLEAWVSRENDFLDPRRTTIVIPSLISPPLPRQHFVNLDTI
jgi:hypothetical protein